MPLRLPKVDSKILFFYHTEEAAASALFPGTAVCALSDILFFYNLFPLHPDCLKS